MKKKHLAILFLFCIVLHYKAYSQSAEKLEVHEWGTFTTLSSADGKALHGLYLDEEKLPDFVHHPSNFPHRLAHTYKFISNKGIYFEPLNVSVKMETPVIYFYSPKELKVHVKVDFPNGFISQWYPACSKKNIFEEASLDFEKPVNGFMEWDVNILPPDSKEKLSFPEASHTWVTPRNTEANLITVQPQGSDNLEKKEVEKFIFYRGIGNFEVPLKAAFKNAENQGKSFSIELKNNGTSMLPFVWIYEKSVEGKGYMYWHGALKGGESKEISLKEKKEADFSTFENALVQAGLYPKEAQAMLATWKSSYFEQEGFRIFWIVPEEMVNQILPLKINPQPDALKRVFVGRYEMIHPSIESKLVSQYKKDNYYNPANESNEKFSLAFQELLKQYFDKK